MEKVELKVEGMTCGGCVNSIQNALNGRNGVNNAIADLESGIVAIEFDAKVWAGRWRATSLRLSTARQTAIP
jgi:copper chaperone CopZ